MGSLRWLWPVALVALLILVPWASHLARPERALSVVVLDKTVPHADFIEHRSLFWLLDHLKIVRPGGGRYDVTRDYMGAYPGARPGDPPARTEDLTEQAALAAELLYLADTYGVYSEDLTSGSEMKAALDRSRKLYGGLTRAEARAVLRAVEAGKTVVAEFNTLGSPTDAAARKALEGALGVRWTRWIGRFFTRLEDPGDVPAWIRRDYEREWSKPWTFGGPGFVLLQDDVHCEVLRVGVEAERIALTLERRIPVDRLLEDARDGTSYPYWFDVVTVDPGTEVLAFFAWHLTEIGRGRLAERGLPERFAAVTRRRSPAGGAAYYFAGDFADNPLEHGSVPFAGYVTARSWLESVKLQPSEGAFYWRFYAPMMTRMVGDLARRID